MLKLTISRDFHVIVNFVESNLKQGQVIEITSVHMLFQKCNKDIKDTFSFNDSPQIYYELALISGHF